MSKNLVELVFIVDRSGSMQNIASDMEGAIKATLEDQKKSHNEKVMVTFVRFDNEIEEVVSGLPIEEIGNISIQPRGMTALLDAMGTTISNFKNKFLAKDEKDRPKRTLFIIITDGFENSSKEYKKTSVFNLVEECKKNYDWGFTFIGANQDSIKEGSSLGVSKGSSLNYEASSDGVRVMARSMSDFTCSYLSGIDTKFHSENDSSDVEE